MSSFMSDAEARALLVAAGYSEEQIEERIAFLHKLRADDDAKAALQREHERYEFAFRLLPEHERTTQVAELEESDLRSAGKSDAEIERTLFGVYDGRDVFGAVGEHIEREKRVPRGLFALYYARLWGGDRGIEAGRAAAESKVAQAYGFARAYTKSVLTMAGVAAEEDLN